MVGMVLSKLPSELSAENDLRLMVELPLFRDDTDDARVTLSEIVACHIGQESEELWLLIRPASEYADGLLPA